MKHIKSYKIFESTDNELNDRLKKFDISKYSINEDGSINCNQDIHLTDKYLHKIPFKFNTINGYFHVWNNLLTSLKNCPINIYGEFHCSHNQLTSLEYGPEYVGEDYWCYFNDLISLKGCVDEVYGDFECYNNKLTSLEFCPMQVEGNFDCSNNKLEYLDRSPFIKGNLYCKRMFKTKPEFNGYCKELIWR